ncbi:GMC oxidoreductase [Bacillus sp. FSL K6-3431]|uniref:GMC oxidoreductase n=1 Tax=Bacillus sp. FSL K6-3431 TaxID=2921500 RepID=UPI0030F5A1E3
MKKRGVDTIDAAKISNDTEFNGSFTTGHFGGGTIMGDNPKISAVNNYSQMWDMNNIFVLDASAL